MREGRPTRRARSTPIPIAGLALCLVLSATPAQAQLATGAGPGGGPHVRTFDTTTGAELPGLIGSFYAYAPAFAGGAHVALCDVSGDGVMDVVTGAGAGGGPHVRVFDGATGAQLPGPLGSFFAYSPAFTGGVFVACADVTGDGVPDVITGAGPGGGPHVQVFDGVTGAVLPGPIGSFFAYDPAFAGGVHVAACDVNADGRADIIAGAGPGGGPHVRAFDGATGAQLPGPLGSFFAYNAAFTGGVFVACADVTGDGVPDLVTGAGPGGGSHVRVFDGATGVDVPGPIGSFFAYDPAFAGGVAVGACDVNGDGHAEVITGTGPGGGPSVRVFDGATGAVLPPVLGSFAAYDPTFGGGVFVACPAAGARFTSADATTFTVGTPGSFTVTVAGTPPAVTISESGALPAGVTFTDNGDGTATLAGTPAPGTGGVYPLTFTVTPGGGAPATQAFTLTVNEAPAITSADSVTFAVGTPGTFTVTTSGFPPPALTHGGGLPAGVTFVDDGNGTGSLGGTPAPGTVGDYALTLTADNGVGAPATQAFTLHVTGTSATALASSANPSVFGQSVTFTATVSPVGGGPTPTGSVTFRDGATVLGTDALDGAGQATLTTSTLAVAAHAIAADYGGDASYSASTAGLTQTVNQAATTTSLITSGDPANLNTAVTFTATVSVVAPGAGTPTGTVSFRDNNVEIGTGGLAGGVAMFATSTLTEGEHPITAVYLGAADFLGSTSNQIDQTIVVPLVANDDTYPQTVIGNVSIDSSLIPYSVLDNDQHGAFVTITTFDATTTQGGSVTMVTSGPGVGRFTYNPPAGFEGTGVNADTFTYTVSDGFTTSTATVKLDVSGMIWFVDANAGSPGDGRLSSPFDTLAAFNAVNDGAGNHPAAGDNVFLYESGTDYVGPVTLLNNQKLIGQDATASLSAITGLTPGSSSATLPAMNSGNGTFVTITSGANAINLAQNNTIRGLTVGNRSGIGINGPSLVTLMVLDTSITGSGQALNLVGGTLNATFGSVTSTSGTRNIVLGGISGTLALGGGALSGSSAGGIDLNTGSATITYSGTISSTNGNSAHLANMSAPGSATFSGAITDTGSGILLTNNTGATISFTGGLSLSTGANAAFTATGGGTVNATQNNTSVVNTISTTTGQALNVQNTTIGASGLTFRSVSAGSGAGSAGTGILLNNTGASGGLTVTGTGAPGSGGTIQHKTGADGSTDGIGISLTSTRNVSLDRMALHDFDNFAIRGTSVTNFTLANSVINGANGTSAAFDEGSIRFDNLLGSASITNSAISGGIEDNLRVTNTSGTLDRLTVTGGTIGLSGTRPGNDGISVDAQSGAVLKVTVTGVTFEGAAADLFGANVIGTGTTLDVVLHDNTFQNAHPSIVSGGGGITIGGGALASTITVTYDISGTSPGAQTFQDADGNAITVNFVNGGGTATGTIQNNAIGQTGVAGSASLNGDGILVAAAGAVTHTVTIDGNTILGVGVGSGGFAGIDVVAGDAGLVKATITNNTVDQLAGTGVFAGLYTLAGGATGTDTATLCADVRNNTIDASGGANALADYFVDQVPNVSPPQPAYRFPGFNTNIPPGTTAALATFIQSAPQGNTFAGLGVDTSGVFNVLATAGPGCP